MQIARLAAVAVLLGSVALAQAPTETPKRPAGTANNAGIIGGFHVTTLIDRLEVRVLRLEMQPGMSRGMHQHYDAKFYLFMPITSGIEVTIGSEKPVMTDAGQAYFMLKGTPYGFRNTGTTPAMAYEVFMNEGPAASTGD